MILQGTESDLTNEHCDFALLGKLGIYLSTITFPAAVDWVPIDQMIFY